MLEIARGATKLLTGSQSIYIGKSISWFGEPLVGLAVSPSLACLTPTSRSYRVVIIVAVLLDAFRRQRA